MYRSFTIILRVGLGVKAYSVIVWLKHIHSGPPATLNSLEMSQKHIKCVNITSRLNSPLLVVAGQQGGSCRDATGHRKGAAAGRGCHRHPASVHGGVRSLI